MKASAQLEKLVEKIEEILLSPEKGEHHFSIQNTYLLAFLHFHTYLQMNFQV